MVAEHRPPSVGETARPVLEPLEIPRLRPTRPGGDQAPALADVFLSFAGPLLATVSDDGPTPNQVTEFLLALARSAWNATLAPESDRPADGDTQRSAARLSRGVIELLIARKKRHFAADTRMIPAFEVRRECGAIRLSFAAAP